MSRFTQRPFVSTAGPVVPGPAAAVGKAISIGGQAVRNVEKFKAEEEDRIQKLQTQQSEKMDRSRALRDVTQKHIARQEAFTSIMEGARKEGNYDNVGKEYLDWNSGYDVDANEGKSPYYQDTYAALDNAQHKSAITRMFNFKQAGNLAVQMEDTRDSYANIGVSHIGDPLEGAAIAKGLTVFKKSEGMQGEFLDPLEFEARKGMVETHLWDTLKGNPLEQEQFLDDIEKDPNTKDIYSDPQIASLRANIRTMVELEKENANNHKVYKTTASSTSINATIAANDRGDIDFNAAMKQIQNSEATDIEKLNGQERLRKRNVAGAKVHDTEQAVIAARNKEAGDTASAVAGKMIGRYQDMINAVEDGDIEGWTNIQTRWNETLVYLLENSSVLPPDKYAGFLMDVLYGVKDVTGGVVSAEPFDHFFSLGERKRSPLVKWVDTIKSQPDRPFNAVKMSIMLDKLKNLPDGFSALADNEEDAQRIADKLIADAEVLFATQELGLSQEQAQERQEVNSKAQSPTPRTVDKAATARAVAEVAKVMPLEEALELNAESASPIPVDEFTAAFTEAKDTLEFVGPREEPDASLAPDEPVVTENEIVVPENNIPRVVQSRFDKMAREAHAESLGKTVQELNRDELASGLRAGITLTKPHVEKVLGEIADKVGSVPDALGGVVEKINDFFASGESVTYIKDPDTGEITIKKKKREIQ